VGASFTEPDACELVVTVRVEEPEVAVTVTEVALVDCQVRVTFCPLLTEVGLAARVTLGVDGVALDEPAQEERLQTAKSRIPQEIQRTSR
jgi:hypothetical protein